MNVFAARYDYFWRALKMILADAKNSKETSFLPVSLALYPCSKGTLSQQEASLSVLDAILNTEKLLPFSRFLLKR
jgi:hypothetical protein